MYYIYIIHHIIHNPILHYINAHMHIHTHACMPPVGSAKQSAGPRLRSHAGAGTGTARHCRLVAYRHVSAYLYLSIYVYLRAWTHAPAWLRRRGPADCSALWTGGMQACACICIWGLVINPVVPGRGTGPGSAKVAKMPGWARGGAGPALWYRAGVRGRVRKNRRHAGLGSRGRRAGTPGPPGSVLVSPGLRACAI